MLFCARKFFIIFVILSLVLFSFQNNQVLAFEFLPTSVEVLVSCGNGIIDLGNDEICDPGDPNASPHVIPHDLGATTTCAFFLDIFGNPYLEGELRCLSDCSGYDISRCHNCGNGYKESAEDCDQTDFGSKTCISLGMSGGYLVCNSDCSINPTYCIASAAEGGPTDAGGTNRGGGGGSATGFLPGSDRDVETKVIMRGKAYSNSDVHVLIDGVVVGIVTTDARADFYFETDEVTPGVASFGFWSEDREGLKSTLLTLTFRVVSGAVSTISGIYISPTINIDNKSIKQGDLVRIFGQTVPETEVFVHIHSPETFIEQIGSRQSGDWELIFDTTPLSEEFHTAKALFQVATTDGNIIKSGFSRSVSFHVGKVGGIAPCPEADLNQDGRVNLTDFSILLFHWGTDNACADQNQNGNVDLIDFSIMMYYWTG